MSSLSFRAQNRAKPSRCAAYSARIQSGATLLLAVALSGCVSYEPAPVEPLELLQGLESTTLEELSKPGLGPAELSALAVGHNPSLEAVRSQVGVSQALLVEAGLLPDLQIGWDAMNVVASQLVSGTATSVDYVAGIGVSMTLPRPGELEALKGGARWRVEQALRQVLRAEWQLARAVHLAFEDVRAAELLLRQNEQLTQVVTDTDEYFQRAREAGVATAMESSLAHGDLLSLRGDTLLLQARVREARQNLNALIGLPPDVQLDLAVSPTTGAADALAELPDTAGEIAELAVERRPDLLRLLAAYEAAEADVQLEITRQFPELSIGTGIFLIPGFFRHFNRPAITTAIARRERLRTELKAAVHEVRREVYDAWSELEESRQQVRFLEAELLPNSELSLQLAGEAFAAGEATLVQILTVQRAVVDARTRSGEAHAELARRTWRLHAAAGLMLHQAAGTSAQTPEQDEPQR